MFILLSANSAFSQISSPGLGKAKAASWLAIGFSKNLGTIKDGGWKSMTYLGLGRKSNPDNKNSFYKPAILVINQEFYHQFHDNWQYSVALSYRKQNEYSDIFPYDEKKPKWQQEFRFYGRFSYIFKTKRIKLTPTFRQEFRKFYAPDFKNAEESVQLRSRFRLQLALNLDRNNTNRLICSSEQLFSIGKETTPNSWTDFNYRESRFSLYYSHSVTKIPVTLSFGYMKNIVGAKNSYNVDYVAFDMVFNDLF